MAGVSPWRDGVTVEEATPTRAGNRRPVGYQQITALSAATALTVPDGARVALIIAEDQSVRWRDDGTAPTGTVGMLLRATANGVEPLLYAGDLTTIQFIETAASAELNVSYYA